jgi:hypothetical protein
MARLRAARFGFATRRVDSGVPCSLLNGNAVPKAGDVVLARVTEVGHHARLELPSGRRVFLRVRDEIVVAYGNRYAPDQFEAMVPADLDPCHLVAGGGVAGEVVARHEAARPPTAIEPMGLLADKDGAPITLAAWALGEPPPLVCPRPLTIAVLGDSMNAGKTTVAAAVVYALSARGRRVGAAKVTGTGSGNDLWRLLDAGADRALDFTDAGHASTYRLEPPELERVFSTLVGHLAADGVDVIVLEVADGLLQAETTALVSSFTFSETVDHVFFAAQTALSAVAGIDWLSERALSPLVVSGVVGRSPLACRELVSAIGVPVRAAAELCDSDIVEGLLGDRLSVAV